MMAMFNDLFELLADLPPTLVTAWAAWIVAGVLLVWWFRRARLEPEPQVSTPRSVSRPKPASRPSSILGLTGADLPMAETSLEAATPSPRPALERPRARAVIGDPFGDLATLLDQPEAPAPIEPRLPADSPILNSSGSPIRRANGKDDANVVA